MPRDGKMTKVPAEKSLLPRDPKGHPQGASVGITDGGTVYVPQSARLCRSTDGGRTWTSHPIPEAEGHVQVLGDGTFIRIAMTTGDGTTEPAEVWRSSDECRTWVNFCELPTEMPRGYQEHHRYDSLRRLVSAPGVQARRLDGPILSTYFCDGTLGGSISRPPQPV